MFGARSCVVFSAVPCKANAQHIPGDMLEHEGPPRVSQNEDEISSGQINCKQDLKLINILFLTVFYLTLIPSKIFTFSEYFAVAMPQRHEKLLLVSSQSLLFGF